ncbi:Aste57867_984 [Aphanomyces stellatus]|uniref:Aste57867_984 protein n=1 Tax=Aphanomyces stellatus TaxID=120398 RepID=A0A485K534_9STRA|nr:hypothetical protein As57867_000983 [Aphanomyces stellatus]VFT78206.1 Aste57867_984 [Aphanomyces stellatus]
MVDYVAILDDTDKAGRTADAVARAHYDNVDQILLRFGCSNAYSLYNCADCREAYKYWVCAATFQKCGGPTRNVTTLCVAPDPTADAPVNCDGLRPRMCVSLCEDVIRKCPYVLNFQCPDAETPYFSKNIATCNKLDRVIHPDAPDKPWPGSFAQDG